MTPADLAAWQTAMHLTAPKAAQAMGVSYATYRDWLAGTSRNTGKPVVISTTTALACSALAAGLTIDSWRMVPIRAACDTVFDTKALKNRMK